MSGNQSTANTSRNSNTTEDKEEHKKGKAKFKRIKIPKTSKAVKRRKKNKGKGLNKKFSVKISTLKSKLKKKFYNKIIHQEIYLDGKEPKSYSFEKKFWGLYGIFIFYSLILITAINIPESNWIQYLMLGNPFSFANAIVGFFLVLSFLFSIDKFRIFIFEKKSAIKQTILYIGIFTGLYIVFLYLGTSINFMTYLLSLAMIWLILLSTRFYMYSRKFATKIEARFIKKYSILRRFFAIIIPFFILGVLVVISLFYRTFLVILSLEIFAASNPSSAVEVYKLEMGVIMPLIYFSLVMTLMFVIFEFVFTRRRAETKRAGTFDNFTFSLIVFFIFFFQIFQISVFFLLQDQTIDAFKSVIGATGSAASYVFIFEFIVSMYFLYRIVKKTGRTLGWRILIFKKDGLILLFLAFVFAQTLTRFSLTNEISNQIVTDIGTVLMADKYIISVLMIFFLGTTLLIYYLKPHETSMFMRLQKETVSEEERNMDKIYKIIRSEYIRRGEAYPIEIIERELIKATQISKRSVYELIEELAKKDMDILISVEKRKFEKPTKMINFVSITERFEKKEVARKKARTYLSQRLFETTLEKKRKTSRLLKGSTTDQSSNSLISSLSTDYRKKQKDKEKYQQKLKEAQISFTTEMVPEDLKEQIKQIIRKEYIYRIENPEKIPDFYLPISEIATQIERLTKINPGELYPILEKLSKEDIELDLIETTEGLGDKKIRFIPYSDDSMIYSLLNFRPKEYFEIKEHFSKNFLKALNAKKDKRRLFQLKKAIPNQTESQRTIIEFLNNLYKYFPLYQEQLNKVPNTEKFLKLMTKWIKALEKQKVS